MVRVTAGLRERDVVPAVREEVWAVVADVGGLDELMPGVASIEPDGECWRWVLESHRALGVTVQPAFTVRFEPTPPRELRFVHVPGHDGDNSSAHGAFVLDEQEASTLVGVALDVALDLRIPSLFVATARQVIEHEMRRMGTGFLANLRDRVRG